MNQTGGTLNASNEQIGVSGAGIFTQVGGTNSASTLNLAANLGSSGIYSLSGGSLTASPLYVGGTAGGAGGTGVLNVSGGSATISGVAKVYNAAGNAINLSGGTLSVGTLDMSGNPARFNWTGGTLAYTNTPTITIDLSFLFGRPFLIEPRR